MISVLKKPLVPSLLTQKKGTFYSKLSVLIYSTIFRNTLNAPNYWVPSGSIGLQGKKEPFNFVK